VGLERSRWTPGVLGLKHGIGTGTREGGQQQTGLQEFHCSSFLKAGPRISIQFHPYRGEGFLSGTSQRGCLRAPVTSLPCLPSTYIFSFPHPASQEAKF
jgi:hypothetical protein